MANIIIAAILMIGIGAAIAYIVKEKRKGTACIGCSYAGTCTSKNNQNSQCNCK